MASDFPIVPLTDDDETHPLEGVQQYPVMDASYRRALSILAASVAADKVEQERAAWEADRAYLITLGHLAGDVRRLKAAQRVPSHPVGLYTFALRQERMRLGRLLRGPDFARVKRATDMVWDALESTGAVTTIVPNMECIA